MGQIAREIPPDAWNVRQIVALAVAFGESGEDAEDLGVALAAEAMGTRPDLRGALVQIDPPVFVLAGAADRAYPPTAQEELARSLPGARFAGSQGRA